MTQPEMLCPRPSSLYVMSMSVTERGRRAWTPGAFLPRVTSALTWPLCWPPFPQPVASTPARISCGLCLSAWLLPFRG